MTPARSASGTESAAQRRAPPRPPARACRRRSTASSTAASGMPNTCPPRSTSSTSSSASASGSTSDDLRSLARLAATPRSSRRTTPRSASRRRGRHRGRRARSPRGRREARLCEHVREGASSRRASSTSRGTPRPSSATTISTRPPRCSARSSIVARAGLPACPRSSALSIPWPIALRSRWTSGSDRLSRMTRSSSVSPPLTTSSTSLPSAAPMSRTARVQRAR